MKIGIISDTHGLLRPEAIRGLESVDHIIHAGDIGSPTIVPRLREIAPVSAIRGNVDLEEWAHAYPETLTFALEGQRIHVVHDRKALALDPVRYGIALVVFGHSHRPLIEHAAGVLWINPGSAGPRRFRLPVTLAFAQVGRNGFDEAVIRGILP